jgi:sulfate adenylyltransferase subunit 2
MAVEEKRLTHLRQLQEQSIHIIRAVAVEFGNLAILYSIGNNSSVTLHLARKAFFL